MDYIGVTATLFDEQSGGIFIALLAELGFESFEEQGKTVKAYIPEGEYDENALFRTIRDYPDLAVSVKTERIMQENWNEVWESNFSMVEIAGRCVIFAPFHKNVPDLPYRICIMPQMSFGTGHHETTSLMAEMMLQLDLAGLNVLDMGCGTGILAILAHRKGAGKVTAIDIDEWAYKNAGENCSHNNITNIEILHGGSELLPGKMFDVIFANINRNILLRDISVYARCLRQGGLLQLSGFYAPDLDDISKEAEKNGFGYVRHLTKKDWVAALFRKQTSIEN
ncbi:MAG: 50S ribosomal protein L11 methyltransferase [Prevotellaceae bacterium]|jgi:ribosomal protein L11 methyltransferase|nr:50S ribosomal protein L11 methyltransferase [Prevotellaceae bacterium]